MRWLRRIHQVNPTFLTLLGIVLQCSYSINLDIHVPLPPNGCLLMEALRANLLLRQDSRHSRQSQTHTQTEVSFDEQPVPPLIPAPLEHVNFFSKHTPHVTLFLSDFALEVDPPPDAANATSSDGNANQKYDDASLALNKTKVKSFLDAVSSLNFTEILNGTSCPLSFGNANSNAMNAADNLNSVTKSHDDLTESSTFYTISGSYTMLPVVNNHCLQLLSTTIAQTLQEFLKHPILVPSWVAKLPEPNRSKAIYRSRQYGSPNVLEGFEPHVTVGYDLSVDGDNLQWRTDAMEQWNRHLTKDCTDEVVGIAVGKTGLGGTVLSGSRMGYWKLNNEKKQGASLEQGAGLRSSKLETSLHF